MVWKIKHEIKDDSPSRDILTTRPLILEFWKDIRGVSKTDLATISTIEDLSNTIFVQIFLATFQRSVENIFLKKK